MSIAAPIPMRISPRHVDKGLVLWIPFYGLGVKAYDLSRYRNHANIIGPIWSPTKRGSALLFDGTDDYVQVPDHPSLRGMAELTVSIWMYSTRTTKNINDVMLSKYLCYYLRCENVGSEVGAIRFYVWGPNGSVATTAISLRTWRLGEWNHIVGSWDGDAADIYVNGNWAASADLTNANIANNVVNSLVIGDYHTPPTGPEIPFKGYLKDIRVYARTLSLLEINHLYELEG